LFILFFIKLLSRDHNICAEKMAGLRCLLAPEVVRVLAVSYFRANKPPVRREPAKITPTRVDH
jgi:hypothetical protein